MTILLAKASDETEIQSTASISRLLEIDLFCPDLLLSIILRYSKEALGCRSNKCKPVNGRHLLYLPSYEDAASNLLRIYIWCLF